jgi:hypothetical protein
MPTTTTTTPPEGVIEHDGMLWKPRRGATPCADEFIAARTVFKEITQDSRWNPWIRDDRAADYEHAIMVMDQWRRAEPGHRTLSTRQLEARWAKQDMQRERALAERKKERAARKVFYDEERAAARLALFEQQSLLNHEVSELVEYRDGTRFPKMDGARRHEQMDALESSIEHRRQEIARLTPVVGDPETVIDQNGWLPPERREAMLLHYRFERERKVRKLRKEIPELTATVERKDRWKVDCLRRELDALLAVPPLAPDDMCSDCPTPLAEHGWRKMAGPCVAWPGPRARLQQAREILAAGIREIEQAKKLPPPSPKPEPLAAIPSGLPIAEITRRLQELQQQFPDAEVRRGRANRWELWPKSS